MTNPKLTTNTTSTTATAVAAATAARKLSENSKAQELLDFRFIPWTDVSELIVVHSNIYASVRFTNHDSSILSEGSDDECSSSFWEAHAIRGRKVYLKVSDRDDGKGKDEIREAAMMNKLSNSRDKLTQWKEDLIMGIKTTNCSNGGTSNGYKQILYSHLVALESILNAILEAHRFASSSHPSATNSVLYSLYSMAVINFCNALASYESVDPNPDNYHFQPPETNNRKHQQQKREINAAVSTIGKFSVARCAQIFQCPFWIVSARNQLAHPCQATPNIEALHEAITFALEWMDRYFWSKLLADQCQMVDVDLRKMTVTHPPITPPSPQLLSPPCSHWNSTEAMSSLSSSLAGQTSPASSHSSSSSLTSTHHPNRCQSNQQHGSFSSLQKQKPPHLINYQKQQHHYQPHYQTRASAALSHIHRNHRWHPYQPTAQHYYPHQAYQKQFEGTLTTPKSLNKGRTFPPSRTKPNATVSETLGALLSIAKFR